MKPWGKNVTLNYSRMKREEEGNFFGEKFVFRPGLREREKEVFLPLSRFRGNSFDKEMRFQRSEKNNPNPMQVPTYARTTTTVGFLSLVLFMSHIVTQDMRGT